MIEARETENGFSLKSFFAAALVVRHRGREHTGCVVGSILKDRGNVGV